jgi:hypothetical protein
MKRVIAIGFALLAGSAMIAAQAVDQNQQRKFDAQAARAQSVLTLALRAATAPPNPACPAAFTAKQGGMGDLVAVKPGQKSEDGQGFSQHIRLSVSGDKSKLNVVAARVTVHGLAPQARAVPVQSGSDGPAQISRTMNVSFAGDSAGESGANLLLRGYTAVLSIDVNSITYADGSTWKSGEGMCRIVPDPLMLIGAR